MSSSNPSSFSSSSSSSLNIGAAFERETGVGGRQTSSETILATVLAVMPAKIPSPEPMETGDNGVHHRRSIDKDSFGSLRELAAPPPAVDLLIQAPTQNNESVPDEMDTGPPPFTFIDSVGLNRPLAQVVVSVPPSVAPAQDIESPPDATDNEATRRPSFKASLCNGRSFPAATTAVVRPYAQNIESAPDVTDNGVACLPATTDSFGSGHSSSAATNVVIKTAPDENEAVKTLRPMDRADTHPEPAALMPPRVPLAQDNDPMYPYTDSLHSARIADLLSAADTPPIANGPQMVQPKEVNETSDTLYEEHTELNEDDVERGNKAVEWIQVLPESEKEMRRWAPCMALILLFIAAVVAITVGGICGSGGCGNDPVSPQPPPTNAPSNAPQVENTRTSQVAIEVQHDRRPEETGWTLRDRTGELIARQSAGSFQTISGTVLQAFVVAVGTYTFEMTDTFGDGICCMNGSGSFQIRVNDETVVSNDGQFGGTVQEIFKAVLTPLS
jgi:hypothetical protein